jgi:S-adenosylmethionine uptake transporter
MIAALLGFLGIVLVFLPSLHHIGLLALSASALSGLATSGNMVIAKRIPYGATQSTIVVWATSIIANVVMAILFREHLPHAGWHLPWLYLVFFAVASITASWSFIRGVKLIEAGAAGVLGLLEIVFGVIFGVFFFNERPGLVVLLGVAVIIVAAAIPYLKDYNAERGTID